MFLRAFVLLEKLEFWTCREISKEFLCRAKGKQADRQVGSSTGSRMCLGSFLRGEHFNVSQRHDKNVEVTGGSYKRLKLSSSETGQFLQKEAGASVVVSNAVFENSKAKAK